MVSPPSDYTVVVECMHAKFSSAPLHILSLKPYFGVCVMQMCYISNQKDGALRRRCAIGAMSAWCLVASDYVQ